MPSDLLSIGRSGAQAARTALDVTAQNIANASSEGYVRRSVRLAEVASAGGQGRIGDVSLSGVRLDAVVREADLFRQSEVRRTGADLARATAEVEGLQNVETAVEQSSVFPAVVQFEGSLERLAGDPVDPSLRAAVLEDARTLVRTFNIASNALDSARDGLHFTADDGVTQVNRLAGELARTNLRLARAADSTSDKSALLDQRDSLLEQLSKYTDVSTKISADDTVEVRLGGPTGPQLVAGGTANPLSMTKAGDGTLSFALGPGAVTISGGSLAGQGLALVKLADTRGRLDAVAEAIMAAVNGAQAGGADLGGNAARPFFTGVNGGAGAMTLALTDGSQIATAPAGAGAKSRNPGALDAMRSALAVADPAGGMDKLLFDISGTVSGRSVTRDALKTIADTTRISLQAQAGVDLDQEAVNLVRYQQAFQASGRVMQIASSLLDTLLAIR
jgi:flagellar hook-associated protein 1 FlgK